MTRHCIRLYNMSIRENYRKLKCYLRMYRCECVVVFFDVLKYWEWRIISDIWRRDLYIVFTCSIYFGKMDWWSTDTKLIILMTFFVDDNITLVYYFRWSASIKSINRVKWRLCYTTAFLMKNHLISLSIVLNKEKKRKNFRTKCGLTTAIWSKYTHTACSRKTYKRPSSWCFNG